MLHLLARPGERIVKLGEYVLLPDLFEQADAAHGFQRLGANAGDEQERSLLAHPIPNAFNRLETGGIHGQDVTHT